MSKQANLIKKQKEDFRDYVLEQLDALPDVSSKRLFSGFGIYCGEYIFAIIHDGRLYFKTDEDSRSRYTERQMPMFQPMPGKGLKSYYEVPVDVLEDSKVLAQWARQAVKVSEANA